MTRRTPMTRIPPPSDDPRDRGLTILANLRSRPPRPPLFPIGTVGSRSRPRPTTASRSSPFDRTARTCARSPTSTAMPSTRTGRRTAAGSPSPSTTARWRSWMPTGATSASSPTIPASARAIPRSPPTGTRLVFEHFDWLGTGARRGLEHEARRDRQAARHRRRRGRSERVARRPQAELQGPGPWSALFVQNMDGSGLVQVSPSVSVAYKHDWAPERPAPRVQRQLRARLRRRR